MPYDAHPLAYASCFIISGPEDISHLNCSNEHFSIDGMSRMLAYGDFLKAQALQHNKSVLSILAKEAALYPYQQREIIKVFVIHGILPLRFKIIFLQVPHLTAIDFKQNSEFLPTLTDAGLCHVLNGNSIGNTYVRTERIEKLNAAFGSGEGNFQPTKINGTGYLNQKTFWLDVGIRLFDLANELVVFYVIQIFCRSHKAFNYFKKWGARWESGSARIAINEWLSHYNMRMAQIEVKAGIETKIKIQPKMRSASDNIREVDPADRDCLFSDENEVLQTITYS